MTRQGHPTDTDLKSFLQGRSSPSTSLRDAWIIRHLLSECSTCKEHSQTQLSSAKAFDYSPAFAAAERAVSDFLAPTRPEAVAPEVLFEDLQRLPEDEQIRSAGDSRFVNVSLVDLLIERSYSKRYKSTQDMLHFARLAVLAADACTVEATANARRLADLRGRAYCNLGNALRVCGRLPEAEEAITAAQRHLKSGTRDPLLRARLLDHQASIRMFQGRNPEAMDLADEAAGIYRELEQTHSFASALVQKAIACQYAGEPENAIAVLNRAIPMIDPEQNPHLLLAACHNLVVSYAAVDRPEQALSLYFEISDLYKEFEDDLNLLRMGWHEGQLLRDLGHLHAAEAALLHARKGFLERNLAHEVAMVSLDLAWVYVKLGWIDRLKQTVTEAVPIFTALRVGREALAMLLQLQHAAGQEQKALEIIRVLNSRLSPQVNRGTNP